MASIEPERIFQVVEPLASRLIAAIRKPPVSLKKNCRAKKTVAVPPVAWAARRAAEAKDALV
jgi:hypothetical protein